MDIDKIEVTDNDIGFIIYPKEKTVSINDNKYEISDSEIKELLKIIMIWKPNYYNSNGLDGVYYNVRVYSNDRIDEYKGLREIPDNYYEFSSLVRRIYDRK